MTHKLTIVHPPPDPDVCRCGARKEAVGNYDSTAFDLAESWLAEPAWPEPTAVEVNCLSVAIQTAIEEWLAAHGRPA